MTMTLEFPKCPICGSGNGYELSGVFSKYAKCNSCSAKWKIILENNAISSLVLHEFPKNGEALYRVQEINAPLFVVIGKHTGLSFWKNLELRQELDWEYLSKNVPLELLDSLVKKHGEVIFHGWIGTRLLRRKGEEVISSLAPEPGALLLTNQRLIWLEMRKTGYLGFVKKLKRDVSFHVKLEILFEDLKGISGESGDSNSWENPRFLSLVDKTEEKQFQLKYAFIELIKPMVEEAIKIRRAQLEAEKKKEKTHIMLDFSFLKNIMEKGGLIMQVLKCPECGATVDFPKKGNETKCNYCGKTIYAQDVFEKVKDLI